MVKKLTYRRVTHSIYFLTAISKERRTRRNGAGTRALKRYHCKQQPTCDTPSGAFIHKSTGARGPCKENKKRLGKVTGFRLASRYQAWVQVRLLVLDSKYVYNYDITKLSTRTYLFGLESKYKYYCPVLESKHKYFFPVLSIRYFRAI